MALLLRKQHGIEQRREGLLLSLRLIKEIHTKGHLVLYKEKEAPQVFTIEPNYFFTDTLIPWSALWLFYFECWLFSGVWDGGGKHPSE